MTVVKVEYYI